MKYGWYFLLILLLFLSIYYPALSNFFSQDDFLLLSASEAKNFKDLLLFFRPLDDAVFYRPISMQLFFYLGKRFFDLNPFGFHLIGFLFHILNIFLTFRLIKILTKNQDVSLVVAFCFGVSSTHFMSLFWICEFSLILSTFFALFSLIYYLQKKNTFFVFFFLLALLSNEIVAGLPFIILSYNFIFHKKGEFKKILLPTIFIFLFFLLRFVLFPTSLGKFYALRISIKQLFSSLRWYSLRAISLPELIKDYLTSEDILKINLLSALVFLSLGFLIPTILAFKQKKYSLRIMVFGIFWFILGLLPVLFMPQHLLSSYLTFSLPGFLLFLLSNLNLKKPSQKICVFISLAAFYLSSLTSVFFLQKKHWIVYRAKIAEVNLKNLKKNYPILENNRIIYFTNSKPKASSELYMAMGGDSAVKLFYKNKTLKVLFEDFNPLSLEEQKSTLVAPVLLK